MKSWSSWICWSLLVLAVRPAAAAVVVCNASNEVASVALSLNGDVSQGWWSVQPGICAPVIPVPLQPGSAVFLYAATAGGAEWQGNYGLCVAPAPFALSLGRGCGQLYARKGFLGQPVDGHGDVRFELPGPSPFPAGPGQMNPPPVAGAGTLDFTNKILRDAKRIATGAPPAGGPPGGSKCQPAMSCADLQRQYERYDAMADQGLAASHRSDLASVALVGRGIQAANHAAYCKELMIAKPCYGD